MGGRRPASCGRLIASFLVAIGVGLFTPLYAEANAVPPGYLPFADPILNYTNTGWTVLENMVITDIVHTGTDANGGFIERTLGGNVIITRPELSRPTNGQYLVTGYLNAGLSFPLGSNNADLTAAPPASNPPSKPPELKNDAGNLASFFGTPAGLVGPTPSLGGVLINAGP
jgi:hypothetical protein